MRSFLGVTLFCISLIFLLIGCAADVEQESATAESFAQALSVDDGTGVAGSFCTTLFAGQHIDAGTVCAEVDANDDLLITYTTTNGWELEEAHLWVGFDLADMPQNKKGNPKIGNFPYHSGDITGSTSYTFVLDLDLFGIDDTTCPAQLIVAAHAALRKDNGDGTYQTETGWGDGDPIVNQGSWATYFVIDILCDDNGNPNPTTCETAFALGDFCFLDIDMDNDGQGDFSRWGWTTPVGESYKAEIYAGAGQCDTWRGTHVGYLSVAVQDSGNFAVTYEIFNDFYLTETHLYVGETMLPLDVNNNPTVAPGQYPYINTHNDVTSYTYIVPGMSGDFLVAHAVVCGEY